MAFRFIILGDIHVSTRGSVPGPFADVLRHVIDRSPRFVVVAGDMTSGNPDDGHGLERVQSWWEAFDGAIAPLVQAGIPVLPVAGNHDSYTAAHRDGYARAWADLTDRVGPLRLSGAPPRWYSIDVDDLHLALAEVVDQGVDREVERWLAADLAASDAPLKLVVGHVPLRSGMGRTNSSFERRLGGLLIEHGVAAYFAGHEHLVWDIGIDVGSGHLRQVIVGTPGARYTFPLRGPLRRAFCRGARGWMPWSRRSFEVQSGTGAQRYTVTFVEVTVDGPAYAVDVLAVDDDGALRPFLTERAPPTDVERLIADRHLQRHLNRVVDAALVVDGIVGPATRAAVRTFQAMEGLPETGEADGETRARVAERAREPELLAVPVAPMDDAPGPDPQERLAEEEIRWLQMALNRLGDAGLEVDGLFGPRSRGALTAWQAEAGLPATGEPDDETIRRLRLAFEALADAPAPAEPLPGTDPADDRVDTRDEVRWLQAALNRVIEAGLVVDGLMGRRTRGAVRAFQADAGLVVDGIAGRRTLGALRTRLNSVIS